jgi:hypothetical protein
MSETLPPLDYLATCSNISLEAFELARLNRAANLRKEIRQALDEWIRAEGEAQFARWLLEHRRASDSEPVPRAAKQLLADVVPQMPLPLFATNSEALNPLPLLSDASSPNSSASGCGDESREVSLATTRSPRTLSEQMHCEPNGALLLSGRVRSPRIAQQGAAATETTLGAIAAPREALQEAAGDARAGDAETHARLHPAMHRSLLERRSASDPFGEADLAPRVAQSACAPLCGPSVTAVRHQEMHTAPPFRIQFGRPHLSRREVSAAS